MLVPMPMILSRNAFSLKSIRVNAETFIYPVPVLVAGGRYLTVYSFFPSSKAALPVQQGIQTKQRKVLPHFGNKKHPTTMESLCFGVLKLRHYS